MIEENNLIKEMIEAILNYMDEGVEIPLSKVQKEPFEPKMILCYFCISGIIIGYNEQINSANFKNATKEVKVETIDLYKELINDLKKSKLK